MGKTQNKQDEDVLKKLETGKYKDHYLVYNRKSTDEADNQKNSISYQKAENIRFAAREGFHVAQVNMDGFCTDGVISEKHSGFKEDDMISFTKSGLVQYRIERPKFQRMLQLINQGYFKGVICLCWDRISRNKGDDTIIRKLMRRGIDVRFVYAQYDNTSAGALHMDIDGMFSQHHSRVTSEKVKLSTKNSRANGICTYRAPMGYLNEGKMDDKPFDPMRAPIIKEIFELYATGNWSLSDLARHANDQGMTTRPMRRPRSKEEMLDETLDITQIEKVTRPITENHVSRILTNQFYTGRIVDTDGTYILSKSHKALVDDELFQNVQSILKKNQVSVHYVEKLDLPLRGMIRCAQCKRVYTPYVKKGIQYYNARCKKDCPNNFKNFNFDYIQKLIASKIENLYFTDDEIEEIDARMETEIALLEEKRNKQLTQIERKKKMVRDNLSYLRSNKLSLLKTGAYSPEDFISEEGKLNEELNNLQETEYISDEAMRETMKDITKLSELIKSALSLYQMGKPHEKEEIIRSIFSELYISENSLEYKVQKGLECFQTRFNALCDPTAWLSELYKNKIYIKSIIENLSLVSTT